MIGFLYSLYLSLSSSESTLITVFYYWILFVGLLKSVLIIHWLVTFTKRHFLSSRAKGDLLKRYGGTGQWAVVTGSSDGIGAEYAR